MIVSFRKLANRLRFTLLFLALTAIVFLGEKAVMRWAHWPDPYAVPQGESVKVSGAESPARPEALPFLERLRLFYLTGE